LKETKVNSTSRSSLLIKNNVPCSSATSHNAYENENAYKTRLNKRKISQGTSVGFCLKDFSNENIFSLSSRFMYINIVAET
jgi:hypothetical protein